MVKTAVFSALVAAVSADVYLHNFRGSNNRLNEKSANRNNGNRMFDSQNNNRGGYNVGDATITANEEDEYPRYADWNMLDHGQYAEVFLEGSKLRWEWTHQHGCGGNEVTDPHKLKCNIVLQYTCTTKPAVGDDNIVQEIILSNGRTTDTSDSTDDYNDIESQRTSNNNNERGRHEGEGWYWKCQKRKRNMGLFTADQQLKGSSSQYTRQNPNGNRRGQECPEERDYYPYWAPTPWVDIAYLTSAPDQECTEILANSGNTLAKGECMVNGNGVSNNEAAACGASTNMTECNALTKCDWRMYSHEVKEPVCQQGAWSRENHLGKGVDGEHANYMWELPKVTYAQGQNTVSTYADVRDGVAMCVARIRYNISTMDYDPWNTTSEHNYKSGVASPVTQNPTINVGAHNLQGLRLAINTAQFGRTFQDRTHTFFIKKRPAFLDNKIIHNLNVRGKRGNIVQTFPSVEYDFIPNELKIDRADYVHVQWTGSNTHNNGNPAGDGQAGDAGEGTGGTDRHNIAEMSTPGVSYPLPYKKKISDATHSTWGDAQGLGHTVPMGEKLWDNFDCYVPEGAAVTDCHATRANDKTASTGEYLNNYYHKCDFVAQAKDREECAIYMISGGHYREKPVANDLTLDKLLNNVSPSLVGGVLFKPATNAASGKYYYMNTRNNNFSNRSQKGFIEI